MDKGGWEIQVKKHSTLIVTHKFEVVGSNLDTNKLMSPTSKEKIEITSQDEEQYGLVPIIK